MCASEYKAPVPDMCNRDKPLPFYTYVVINLSVYVPD